jgi:orotidine-5'-phosphate decarboxylase
MFTGQDEIIFKTYFQMNAIRKLNSKNHEGKFICIGLDTDINKIPGFLKKEEDPVYEFNKLIIDRCSKYAAAFKLNFAFYERAGYKGFQTLEKTLAAIPDDLLVIADAKRGDIGNTSQMYAESIFDVMKFDSITVNPYMGEDSISPFLKYSDKLIFILALTSNPGAADFEKLKLENGSFLFQAVIDKVNQWNVSNNFGIVFGATKIEELVQNINKIKDLPVLLPGIGAQGGSLNGVIKLFKDNNRTNFLINVSRGIIYKSDDTEFAEAALQEITNLNQSIKLLYND